MSSASWQQKVPQLDGALVLAREVETSDAASLFELLSDPAVTAHLSQPPPSASAFLGFITWAQRQRAEGQSVCFAIVPHGLSAAVGIIQVRALEPSWFTAEWGFALGAPFWGTGIFVDAASLVADFTFSTLNAHRIEARAVRDNARGHAAIQKLGARAEGTLAKAFRKDGRLDQQLLWSMTRDEWQDRDRAAARITTAEAMAQIARAVGETQQLIDLKANEPVPDSGDLYPFFLTNAKSMGRSGRRPRTERNRRRVLLIDDNPTQLGLYAMVLEEAADVETAARGEAGFQLACRERPDVIIVDILMPDVDGLELARRFRSTPATADIPIVVLTGDDAAYARAQGEALAFSAILMKPCPASLLLGVVKAAANG